MGRLSMSWSAPLRSTAARPLIRAASAASANRCGMPPGGSGSMSLLSTPSGSGEAGLDLRKLQRRLARPGADLHVRPLRLELLQRGELGLIEEHRRRDLLAPGPEVHVAEVE